MNVDRTKLNALLPNLDIGKVADPELRQAVFEEIYTELDKRPENTEVLTKTNTTAYTPTSANHPATKKFTEDAISAAITSVIGTAFVELGPYFPVTPTTGQTFFNTTEGRFYVFVNSVWNASVSITDLANKSVGSQLYSYKNMGGF